MNYSAWLFLVDKCYGGPEEGGWWYTAGEPVGDGLLCRWFQSARDAYDFVESDEVRKVLAELNEGRPGISSMASRGRYEMCITAGMLLPFPAERPYYE